MQSAIPPKPEALLSKFEFAVAPLLPPEENGAQVVAIAASAGGLVPLMAALVGLPRDFPAAVIVLQHRTPQSRLPEFLAHRIALPVREASEGDRVRGGLVLVAPPRIHMTVDAERRVRLIDAPPIQFVRPAADVLFRSLADVFGAGVVAVVLSGCGDDGTAGSRAIRAAGGLVLAQDAFTSERPEMPALAFDVGRVDVVLRPEQIGPALCALAHPMGLGGAE